MPDVAMFKHITVGMPAHDISSNKTRLLQQLLMQDPIDVVPAAARATH